MAVRGGLIVKATPFDATPPATAVIAAVPELAIRLAGTAADNCVALKNVVNKGEPFQSTIVPEVNPAPFTVSEKAGPPAITIDGFSELMTGAAPVVAKFTVFDVNPPKATVMAEVPDAAIRLAGTAASSCVALTYVVDNGEPFHCTMAPEANPLPV